MLVVLLAVVLLVWVPYRRSVVGRAALAIGSSEGAAYMSGVAIGRTKIVCYTLAGLLAAIGGVLLTCVTYSGEASAAIGGVYTLNSIAAVVNRRHLARRRRGQARSARCSARCSCARSATCCSSSTWSRCGSRCSRA